MASAVLGSVTTPNAGNSSKSSVESFALSDSTYVFEPQNPDREPTRRQDTSVPPPVEAQEYALELSVGENNEEHEQDFKQVEKHLYQRKFGGWYAKLPDPQRRGTRSIPVSPQTSTTPVQKIRSWRSNNFPPAPQLTYTFMFLKLPWRTEMSQERRRLVVSRFQSDFRIDDAEPTPTQKTQQRSGSVTQSIQKPIPGHVNGSAPAGGADRMTNPALSTQTQVSDCQTRISESLLWQHARHSTLSIAKIKNQMALCKDYGVSESEYNLFEPHLSDRLKHDYERSFVGGKYLRPVTLRYVIQYLDMNSLDQACIFFSFPYLSLRKPETRILTKDKMDHPPRTLLQYKYHLHDTKDRDKVQCLDSLQLESLGDYMCAKPEHKKHALFSLHPAKDGRWWAHSWMRKLLSNFVPGLSPKTHEGRLYIPQLWGLLPGSNNLITCGTCDVDSLCGDHLRLADSHDKDLPQTKSLIRLQFDHNGRQDELYYPVERCNSWYGLLNKHLSVEESMAQEKARMRNLKNEDGQCQEQDGSSSQQMKPSPNQASGPTQRGSTNNTADASEKMEFEMLIEDSNIPSNSESWIQALKERREQEVFTVKIQDGQTNPSQPPKIGAAQLSSQRSQNQNPVQSQNLISPSTQGPSLTAPADVSRTNRTSNQHAQVSSIDKTYQGITFLEWPIQDEFSQISETPIRERAIAFLDTIFRRMFVSKQPSSWKFTPKPLQDLKWGEVSVEPLKISALQVWIENNFERASIEEKSAMQLLQVSRGFIGYFMPNRLVESLDCDAMLLIGGLLKEILRKLQVSPSRLKVLENLCGSIASIMKMAKKIHQGVLALTQESAPGYPSQSIVREELMDGTILLSALIDALAQFIHLLAVAVASDLDSEPHITRCRQCILHVLQHAQGQLIREANRQIDSETPGPILTPEGAAIALMDRLVSGTCGRASLNVIGMYELCLEKMALEVKFEASRGLLRKLNGFVEEATIIGDVLKQQTNVLLQFRASLDPVSFHNPALVRRLHFRYESQEIDRILIKIREQIRAFEELKERAKQLAQENVQLVETSQEQNSKYLFVFTVVTVVFLPPSFVSSFFGMNLSGTCPGSWGVELFWIIAVPLTVGVIILALVFARTIDNMIAKWSRWWNQKKLQWFGV